MGQSGTTSPAPLTRFPHPQLSWCTCVSRPDTQLCDRGMQIGVHATVGAAGADGRALAGPLLQAPSHSNRHRAPGQSKTSINNETATQKDVVKDVGLGFGVSTRLYRSLFRTPPGILACSAWEMDAPQRGCSIDYYCLTKRWTFAAGV
eukprot:3499887-Rhodomonas_salina.2